MIELTKRHDRSLVLVAPAHIASIAESGKGSTVYISGGNFHEVFETPREILDAITMNTMYQVPPVTLLNTAIGSKSGSSGVDRYSGHGALEVERPQGDTFRSLGDCVHEMMERIHTKREDRD